MTIRESDEFLDKALFSKAFENIGRCIQLASAAGEGKWGLVSNITSI